VFRQVLVPIDGSPGTERLVRGAATAAARLDAGLLLWGVLHHEADRRAVEHRLHDLLTACADGHGAFMAVATEDPVEAIVERADGVPGTLLCVISHGQGRIGEASLGCLTEELLRRTRTPALVIGPNVDVTVTSAVSWRRVVACVDASDRGERALGDAAEFARTAGLDLVVAQAVTPDDVFDCRRSRCYVESLASAIRPPATPCVLDGGHEPAQALWGEANRLGGAVLAVASRGRSGMSPGPDGTASVGTVTRELIRHSRGPVLVIPVEPALAGNPR